MAEAGQPSATDPLSGLVDIPLPAPISLWPQTWPLRITIVVLAVGLIAVLWWFIHWWRTNRYRREALAELNRIEHALATNSASSLPVQGGGLGWGSRDDAPLPPTELAACRALALLVRRTALAAFPREQVAALSGASWLSFLDRTCGGHEFAEGSGRVLDTAPYRPVPIARSDLLPLINLVRRWIKVHHG